MTYPQAKVELEVKGRALTVKAAVSETLPQSVLLGTDVPDLSELMRPGAFVQGIVRVGYSPLFLL